MFVSKDVFFDGMVEEYRESLSLVRRQAKAVFAPDESAVLNSMAADIDRAIGVIRNYYDKGHRNATCMSFVQTNQPGITFDEIAMARFEERMIGAIDKGYSGDFLVEHLGL